MLSYPTPQPVIIHRTVAHRAETENMNIEGAAWEFNCPHCDYQAGYRRSNNGLVMSELTIWNQGDPRARHHNSFASEKKEEMWLTPALCQQMETLLQDIRMD